MTWVRLDDDFPDHPKVIALSDAALAAWLRGLCYASRYLTDGHVPAKVRRVITRKPSAIQELVDACLWDADQLGDGWWIHDYTSYNSSRQKVEQIRKKRRAAGIKGNEKRWSEEDAS